MATVSPQIMNGKKVLITGHRGFLAQRLIHLLTERFPAVQIGAFDDFLAEVKTFQPDFIFHMAWRTRLKNSETFSLAEALAPTHSLLDILLQMNSQARTVIPGSAAEYGAVQLEKMPVTEDFNGCPETHYGRLKSAQTELGLNYSRKGLQVVLARIFNVIGKNAPEHTVIGQFTRNLSQQKMESGNLNLKRDFVDLDDVCNALIALALRGKTGEIYNVCSGESVPLKSVFREIASRAHHPIQNPESKNHWPSEIIPELCGSFRKIQMETGWTPEYRWEESIVRLFQE